MAKLKIVTAQGYTKEEAFKNANLQGLELKSDATIAWKNEEKPEADSKYFEAFATDHLAKKIKGAAGIAFSITVESGIADSRERPYKVTNVVTKGARKWKMVYQGFTDVTIPGEGGTLVISRDTKEEAEEIAKQYVSLNKKDVEVRVGKEVTDGQALAMTVSYTPSISTKLGTYIFFGYEA